MTRLELRTIFLRRANAVVGVEWQNSEVNRLLDLGATRFKAAVVKWKPSEAIRVWRIPIAVDPTTGRRDQYLFPSHGESIVRGLVGTVYKRCDYYDPFTHDAMVKIVGAGGASMPEGGYYWTRRGRYLQLLPEPTADLAAGIELEFHTSRVIFLSDIQDADSDWGIEFGAQMAIVHAALSDGLSELKRYDEAADEEARYERLEKDIPSFYPSVHGEPIMPQMPHR